MNIALQKYIRKGFEPLVIQVWKLSWEFDDNKAGVFIHFVPEPQEINIANDYDGEIEELDDASKFILYFKDVPAFESRCKFIQFQKSLPDSLISINESLN